MADEGEGPFKHPKLLELAVKSHFADWVDWLQAEAKVGAWTFDVATSRVWWSDEVYRIYDLPLQQPVENSLKYYGDRGAKLLTDVMNAAMMHGESWDLVLSLHSAKGNQKFVRSTGHLSEVDGKKIVHGIFQDVTSWYSDLHSFQKFWENSPDFILKLNRDGIILDVNFTLQRLSRNDVVGRSYLHFAPPQFKEITEKAFNQCVSTKSVVSIEHDGLGEDPHLVYHYKSRFVPILIDGHLVRIFMIVMDITEEVNAKKELDNQKMISEHQSRLAQIGTLAAGVGHEINNPLAIVLGSINSLKRKIATGAMNPQTLLANLADQREACLRIRDIVAGLRDFARVDKGDLSCCVEHVVELTQRLVRHIYEAQGLELKVICPSDQETLVPIDRGALQMALLNLLSNAADATKTGSSAESVDARAATARHGATKRTLTS